MASLSPKRQSAAVLDIVTWPAVRILSVCCWQGYEHRVRKPSADMERVESVWKAPLWPDQIPDPRRGALLLLQGFRTRLWPYSAHPDGVLAQ